MALGPVKLPQSCNWRALLCPGKSLLWFSHMCLGKTKDTSILKLGGKTLLGLEIHAISMVLMCLWSLSLLCYKLHCCPLWWDLSFITQLLWGMSTKILEL